MDSPGSSSGSTPDIQAKYGKLAGEYSKVRAQLGVLKKAVLDEQEKYMELEETMKAKDQLLRKAESEMDSVKFRNDQLARRVEILQEEISPSKKGGVSKRGGGQRTDSGTQGWINEREALNSVIGEELEQKIQENARLHATLDSVDKKYEDRVAGLHSKIAELEATSSRKMQSERADDTRMKDLINGLKANNADLTIQVQKLEKDLMDKNDRVTMLQVQLESASMTNDQNHSLAVTDAHLHTVEILSQIGPSVHDLVAALSDYHTYWESRLKDNGGDRRTESSIKLSELLMQNVKHLKPIEQAFQDVLSWVLQAGLNGFRGSKPILIKFNELSDRFKSYKNYVLSMEDLTLEILDQESGQMSISSRQREKNSSLKMEIKGFNLVLTKLAASLVSFTGNVESKELSLETLVGVLSQLKLKAKELHVVYLSKTSAEDDLPTVSNQLKNTNQCILAAINSIEISIGEIVACLQANMINLRSLLKTAFCDMEQVPEPIEEVPEVEDAASNSETDDLKETIANFQQQVETLHEKLKAAEQSKEHWKLECQLAQMKYHKVAGKEDDSLDLPDVKKVYESRIDGLVSERMMADSKAVYFYLECSSLLKHLKLRERDKDKLEAQLKNAHDLIASLNEDVVTTSSNYEGQLKTMTEHVANLNDQLAVKADESEQLKHELRNKSKKK